MPKKLNLDENEVINLYAIHKSILTVSKLLSCSHVSVRNILKKHNIQISGKSIGLDENQVILLYEQHKSLHKVSIILKCSISPLIKILKKYNIDINGSKLNLDENKVINLYNIHNSTVRVAELLNCNSCTISKILRRNGIELNKTGKRTHDLTYQKTYRIWKSLKQRCFNPNHSNYKNYGGRGITLCEEWLDFNNFLEDMGECPKNYFIKRLDVEKGYNKDNCIWCDDKIQQRNKTKTLRIDGIPLIDIYENSNCNYSYSHIKHLYHNNFEKLKKVLNLK